MAAIPIKGVKVRGKGLVIQEQFPNTTARKWKFISQRAVGGAWLDRSGIPVLSDTLTWGLKNNSLVATIDPQYYGLLDSHGTPLMDEWGTFIYAECNGEIQWGGILTLSDFTGPSWQIQCTGFRGYPAGQIFTGDYAQYNVDPFDIVSALWTWMQAQPSGNLGVIVAGNVAGTPVRLGTAIADQQFNPSLPPNGGSVKNSSGWPVTVGWITTSGVFTQVKVNGVKKWEGHGVPPNITIQSGQTITVNYSNKPGWIWTGHVGIPYSLRWWNGADIGQELDQLSSVTPFDTIEAHQWNADRSNVTHTISLAYPRAGTRRSDLRFVEGENIVVVPQGERDGTAYANAVAAFGAGSGSTTTHWFSGRLVNDNRLYRSYAFTNASVTQADKLAAAARKDAQTKYQLLTAQTVTVADHPHAPIGSYREGDDILVQFTSGWLKGQSVWHRITQFSYSTKANAAVLSLARSDSFSYATGDLSTILSGA